MRELPGACEAMYRASSYVSQHTIADRAPISYEANLCTEKQTQDIFFNNPQNNGQWMASRSASIYSSSIEHRRKSCKKAQVTTKDKICRNLPTFQIERKLYTVCISVFFVWFHFPWGCTPPGSAEVTLKKVVLEKGPRRKLTSCCSSQTFKEYLFAKPNLQ